MTSATAVTPSSHQPAAHSGGHGRAALPGLTLAALGIVFGDIGTSPLYSMQTVFSLEHNAVKPTYDDIMGVISLVIWCQLIIVTFKYISLVMRADNEGEGGILSLVALLRDRLSGRRLGAFVLTLGIIGAGLFYGDSFITPAISVMSSVEGLTVINEGLGHLVVYISAVILTVLFVIQRWGTGVVGKAFGPVMVLWFLTLGVLGIPHIIKNPHIVMALSPTFAINFFVVHPLIAFIAMGAVVLTITGAEALYADMGHFGKKPIRIAWLFVFSMLLLNYFGQGALMLDDPAAIDNPFFRLAPSWSLYPLVGLATLATVIASQAVISGAFSVSRQATRLGLLPRLEVRHTSKSESGQIYVPTINWMLFFGVMILIIIFQSSQRLATAYGLAVTGTEILTSTLFMIFAHTVWGWGWAKIVPYFIVVQGLEYLIFFANVSKIISGGWLPLAIAGVIVLIMTTWRRGAALSSERRESMEGPLDQFVDFLYEESIPRVPGVAVYPHPPRDTTPLALRHTVDFNRVVHEHTIIISLINENIPHVPLEEAVKVNDLGFADDGIVHVTVHVGFNDSQDLPLALAAAVGKTEELEIDVNEARYFLSTFDIQAGALHEMPRWRRSIFVWLQRNAGNRTAVFHLPPERTVVMGASLNE